MAKRLTAMLLGAVLILSLTACGAEKSGTRTVYAMDTVMNLSAYGKGADAALERAEETLHTLDTAVLSRTAEGSGLSRLNAAGGSACPVDETLGALIETALMIADATNGAFDPTLAPVLDAWGFTKEVHSVPSDETLSALLARTGADKVSLVKTEEGYSVSLSDDAQLDLGGIAKGYAADVLRAQLTEDGIVSAVIDLGGDVCVLGKKNDGSAWRVAVKDPQNTESYLGVLEAADECIVTSGVYERYFEENGVRYHHIIDPATGKPAQSGLISVSVVCESGVWADALSTACFVLGEDGALALREKLAAAGTMRFDLILVTEDGRVLYTGGLAERFAENEESGYSYEAIIS